MNIKLKLSIRLYASFAIILILLAAFAVTEISTLDNLKSRKDKMVTAMSINESALITRRYTLGYYDTKYDEYAEEVERGYNDTLALADKGLSLYKQADDLEIIRQIRTDMDAYYNLFLEYIAVTADEEQNSREDEIKKSLSDMSFKITDASSALANEQETIMNDEMAGARTTAIILGGVTFALGILLAWLLTKSLVNRLKGNMDALSTSASLVASTSIQLNAAGQRLSEGCNEQAASIEETSATMDETSSMVQQNSDNMMQANNLSKQASSSASEGAEKMKNMTRSMDELKKSSGEISKIIKVIDDIAFQTNMLALNAAVEAARAGDAGQGFAVVAEEVRNLAQKSAKAAKDTVEIIERNIDLSEQGVVLSEEVSESLNEILEKTIDVNRLISEVSAAGEEQAKGTNQVNEAIVQMEKVVQSNAATAEESAASAEELQRQAKTLGAIVYNLNELVKGANPREEKKEINEKPLAFPQLKSPDRRIIKTSGRIISPDDVIPLGDDDNF